MRFTLLILILISNLKNVYGHRRGRSFKKDCKHGLDLVGFDELDGKYKQVNSIYYKDDNTSKAFEVHLNDTCHWELESNILSFPKYECKTQCSDILNCTNECINLIDCDVWEKKDRNHTSFITPIVKRSRCIDTLQYFLTTFYLILIICVLSCLFAKRFENMKKIETEHALNMQRIYADRERNNAEHLANIERIDAENTTNIERIRTEYGIERIEVSQ